MFLRKVFISEDVKNEDSEKAKIRMRALILLKEGLLYQIKKRNPQRFLPWIVY